MYPALRDLALSARLQMVQALDADEFSASKADPATAAALQQAAQYQAALRQQPAEFVPLEEQVLRYNSMTLLATTSASFAESFQGYERCLCCAACKRDSASALSHAWIRCSFMRDCSLKGGDICLICPRMQINMHCYVV